MKNILLLSDTHSHLDERILEYAQQVDEKIKPLRGVYGNIDNHSIRASFPEVLRFTCENVDVLIIHIGGYPGKYSPLAKTEIQKQAPKLFISGHSHILKAMYDQKNSLLHLNPGACGKSGWHKMRTMMRFQINGDQIENLEVIELGTR